MMDDVLAAFAGFCALDYCLLQVLFCLVLRDSSYFVFRPRESKHVKCTQNLKTDNSDDSKTLVPFP